MRAYHLFAFYGSHRTVLSMRASNSRPDMGFVNIWLELFNAAGARVMSLKAPLMFGRRSPGEAAA